MSTSQETAKAILQFRKHIAVTYPTAKFSTVFGVDGDLTTLQLGFVEGTDPVIAATIQSEVATYDWTLIPEPDIKNFYMALFLNQSLSLTARLSLPLTQPLMEQNVSNPTLMNAYFHAMCAETVLYSWLDHDTQQIIVDTAGQFNVPLTMPS